MSVQVQTCQRCGGARFYGTGSVGWGGPMCNCQYPQVANPDQPPQFQQFQYMQSFEAIREIIERLMRIEAKLDSMTKDIK